MEHACYRCSNLVEDQTPFCPSCGAPQIRVSAREPSVAEPAGPVPPPPAPSLSAEQTAAHPQLSGKIHWKTFFRIAVFPAVITAFASGLPLLGLLVFLGSAVSVVRIYQRRSLMPVRASQGAQMGAVLGLMSFLVLTVPSTLFCALDRNECHQALTKALNDAAPNNPDPKAQEFMRSLASLAQSEQGLFGLLALAMCFFLIILMALGAASGAITAALSADKSGP